MADTYRQYRDELMGRMHAFAVSGPFTAEMFDADLSDPTRPPVFATGYRHLNLILPRDADLANAIRATVDKGQHKWFGSMMSSQAVAQSVFGAIIATGRFDLLARVRAESSELAFEGADGDGESKLEKEVDWLGEAPDRSTSIDTYFQSQTGYRVAVECKLTEREFGACSRPGLAKDSADLCDGSYTVQLGRRRRCSLSEIGIAYWDYIPKVFGWSAQEDHSPCPARFTYQLVRNLLAALVHDSEVRFDRGHAVVVYDGRNPRFQPDGVARLAVEQIHEALGPDRRDRLRVVTWQAIAAALSDHPDFAYLVAGLEEKYGIVAVTGDDDSPSEPTDASQAERLREATRMARLVMLRVAGDGGVLDQLEQVPDDRLERLDAGHVEQLIGDLLEATELVREIRADDIPLLGYYG